MQQRTETRSIIISTSSRELSRVEAGLQPRTAVPADRRASAMQRGRLCAHDRHSMFGADPDPATTR
jgi:hypothetical protein